MESRQQPAATACAHRWQIAPPSGAFSKGICTKCHEERVFSNSSEASTFGYGRTRPRPAT
jgi:hypothetical protein